MPRLDRRGVGFSAGVVGFPNFKEEIAALRRELPVNIYLVKYLELNKVFCSGILERIPGNTIANSFHH